MTRTTLRTLAALRLLCVAALALSAGLLLGGAASPAQGAPAAAPPPPQLLGPVTSIPTTRVLDTRGTNNGPVGFNPDGTQIAVGPLPANAVRRFLLTGRPFAQGTGTFTLPATTAAVLARVTTVGGADALPVTVFPGHVADADRPSSSGLTMAAAGGSYSTLVGLGPAGGAAAGTLAVFAAQSVDVVVEVVGYAAAGAPFTLETATNSPGLVQTDGKTAVGTWVGAGQAGSPGGWLGTLTNDPLRLFTNGGAAAVTVGTDGNVGIGAGTPVARLHLAGPESRVRIETTAPGAFAVTEYATDGRLWHSGVGGSTVGNGLNAKYYVYDATANATRLVITPEGKVGIGTLTPYADLQVAGDVRVDGRVQARAPGNLAGIRAESEWGAGVAGSSSSGYGVEGNSDTGAGVYAYSARGNLVVGYNRSGSPQFHVDNNGAYVSGSDFAEALPARGGRAGFEPGDVLALSDEEAGTLELAGQPNDPRVAGVYSTRPGFLGADKGGVTRVDEDDVPLAIVGVVPTKVSAENGPIKIGDLLTTSSTPGHAMKATPVVVQGVTLYPTGALLGKAMEPLAEGTGVIRVLVSLR